MAKLRSPNFPKFDLETAITKINQVYQAEHTHAADKEVIARDLGYTSLNGASLTTIGALNSYGLLESEGDGLKVGGDAVTILELPKGHAERVAALRRRAFTPKLFADLKQEFGDNLPSDVNLRHSLIKKKFLPKAADEAIRVYRETIKFVSDEAKEYNAPDAGKPEGESKPARETPMQQPQVANTQTKTPAPSSLVQFYNLDGTPALPSKTTELAFKLSRGSEARVTIIGDATQEAIDKLMQHLGLTKDTFPTVEELNKPRMATWHNKDHDQPVTVIGDLGEGPDGKHYLKIAESDTGVPESDLEFEDTKAKGAA